VPFNGLARHTGYAVPGPAWARNADGSPLAYTFDSTGQPFWRAADGSVMSIPAPYALPQLSDLQASALVSGIGTGITEFPSALANGVSDLVQGNFTVDSLLTGLYENSPVGVLGAMADDRYGAAGQRLVGTGAGFATGAAIGPAASLVVRGAGAFGRHVGPVLSDATEAYLARVGGLNYVTPVGGGNSLAAALQGEIARIGAEGHALLRHGESVTNTELFVRATTGVAPDGSVVVKNGQVQIPPSSTAFNSNAALAQSDLLLRQNYLDRAVAFSPAGAPLVTIEGVDVGAVVGRGFDRITTTPGGVGPVQYFDNLSRVTGVYRYDAASGTWRTVTIYPVKR
jgi:hypothetical protein